MYRRKTSSTRWVRFPNQLEVDLKQAFQEVFSGLLKEHQWYIEGYYFPEEVVLSVGFGHPQQLKHHHFHLSWTPLDPDLEAPKAVESIFKAADELQRVILCFLEEAKCDSHLTREWTALNVEGLKDPFLCYSTENLELERWADQILGEAAPSTLTGGDWDPTELEAPQESENKAQKENSAKKKG